MPALRKSARERDFRSQQPRSSTTPYASPTGTPGESTYEKKQRSITEWTEPQPQTLAPSFEEHGFARHGVLENMAPLGVPPKAKDKQRARALGEPAPRHAFLGKGSTVFGDEVGSTPEVTPAPELEPEDSERQEEDEMQTDFPVLEEDEDDDYEPTKTKKKGKVSKTPVRGKTPVQSKTPVHGKTPVRDGQSKSESVSASPAVQAVQAPLPADAAAQRMLIAVNDAISRANKDDRRSVGIALKEVFEQSRKDAYLAAVMDSVIHRNSTDEQWDEFRLRIKSIKKRIRNETKRQRTQEERHGRRAVENHREANFTQQASPRASSEVVPDDSVSAIHDTEDQHLTGSKSSTNMDTSMKDTHRALQSALEREAARPPHPFSTAPALPVADASAESTPRMSSKSPRKRGATNGHLVRDSEMDIDGGASTTAPTPAVKTPDTGASDSELSEVNEEIVQKGPPEAVQANGKSGTPVPVGGSKKGKNAAHARAAKKTKGHAGKLFGKHAYKQPPPTAEQQAEDDRVWEMRNSLAAQQPIRHFEQHVHPPISDVRFDDEILETESLTESQIAVGPPVDSDQPRRAGRVPHGTKRLREDPSRFSSPQLESAVVTRPSTPAVGPAPKRIKLTNGQAARTKRSSVGPSQYPFQDRFVAPTEQALRVCTCLRHASPPVKNRDGGPIAGVAFNGGGGSRQLGPDDNDPVSATQIPEASNHAIPLPPHNPSTTFALFHPPTQMLLTTNFTPLKFPYSPPLSVISSPLTECQNSPQSDSDDFCSACRGPGEFVCCEGCPRVFHLLCCDPPRTEVPDGAFYCHECNAKLSSSDESAAESYTSLGPLFKSLERINPRAFALPQEVQRNFEGISARADGSYFEEVKKFQLAKNSGYGYQRPDYTKVFDGDQKPILCTQCGVSSGHKRQMLKCDFCHAYWHLDCLDPPLANPPQISLEASQRDAWRCPRHIEHDLRSGLLLQKDLNEPDHDVKMADAAPVVRVARKLRKRREPDIVEPTFTRGMRNNGLIEILNDPDDDTDEEGNYVYGPDDSKDMNSKVFRVPEKGLILDFVSKVKSGRVAKEYEARRAAEAAAQRKASMQHFFAHSIQQQQTALSLAQLARKESDIGLGEGKVSALILSLTSEAPPDVITALDNAAPPPLTEDERAQLLKLEALIQRRLKA
ncbi:Nn.00g109220.m01.CDS01 [Neocucurbitaria sp. VM-36]